MTVNHGSWLFSILCKIKNYKRVRNLLVYKNDLYHCHRNLKPLTILRFLFVFFFARAIRFSDFFSGLHIAFLFIDVSVLL